MKVIFLDIDGVLNSQLWYSKRRNFNPTEIDTHYPFYEFDPDLVNNLNRIVENTGAKIVVSSTWRKGRSVDELQTLLDSVGFIGEVIGKTKSFSIYDGNKYESAPRGCEIASYLREEKFQRINWSKEEQQKYIDLSNIKNYIILDDDSDMLYSQREHFVHTPNNSGLGEYQTNLSINILNKSLIDLYY